jgi:hypothetical protein
MITFKNTPGETGSEMLIKWAAFAGFAGLCCLGVVAIVAIGLEAL